METWCILRTAGRSTLPLAESLNEAGYEAWAPTLDRVVHVPRANAKRKVKLAILPGLVFAKAEHLPELQRLEEMNARQLIRKAARQGRSDLKIGDVERFDARDLADMLAARVHSSFTIFRHQDLPRLVLDAELEPLRAAEARAVPRRKRAVYEQGSTVRIDSGPFGGMTGIVEKSDGKYVTVWITIFGKVSRVKISTFILKPKSLQSASEPNLGLAA